MCSTEMDMEGRRYEKEQLLYLLHPIRPLRKNVKMSPHPPFLQKGDTIAILSTARKIEQHEIDAAVEKLQEWGLFVESGRNLFNEDRQFAGTVDERLQDLQWALDTPHVKAILCARGGYGTVQLIDRVDFRNFRENPKWIIGYSDVTVLHSHINRHLGIPTIHASMAVNFAKDRPEALDSLYQALFQGLTSYSFSGDPDFDRAGKARGHLIGGNLSILYSLTGTDSMFDPRGKILFVEDLDEYLYHVDRMMQNLRKSGVLGSIEGLLVGGLTDMNDNQVPYGRTAKEIVAENMEGYDIPVAYEFPAGHLREQQALYFGVPVELEVGEQDQLEFL